MYRLYVSSQSPYSMKALGMVRYAGLPCEVELQRMHNRLWVLKRLTGQTMVPVLRRGQWAINDSTRIARYLVEARPGVRLLPRGERARWWCWVLEDFMDEWVAKWFIYNRWGNEEDAAFTRHGVGQELAWGLPVLAPLLGEVSGRLVPRAVRRAGVHEGNEAAMLRSRDRILMALEVLFSGQGPSFLFEEYPTVADFALYGPLDQYRRDPTGGRHMRAFSAVGAYLDRVEGCFAPGWPLPAEDRSRDLSQLEGIVAEFVGTYWRLLVANEGSARGRRLRVEMLDGTIYEVRAAGYFSKCYAGIEPYMRKLVEQEGGDLLDRMGGELRGQLAAQLGRISG